MILLILKQKYLSNYTIPMDKKYHFEHRGISRYEKLRLFQSTLLEDSVNQEQIDALADQFS